MQKLHKLNLVKTGLKSKFGVIFSHELCLYITKFLAGARYIQDASAISRSRDRNTHRNGKLPKNCAFPTPSP